MARAKAAADYGTPLSWSRGWQVTAVFAAAYIVALGTAHLFATGTLPGGSAPLLEGSASASSPVVSTLAELLRSSRAWLTSWAPLSDMPKEERLRLLFEENAWKNSLVMWALPAEWREALPHVVQTWLRCVVLCAVVYFVTGAAWCYYVYHCFGDLLFKPGTLPGVRDVAEQIKVSCLSIPLYSVLPALTEYAAEQGWTMAYPRVDNVGLPMYAVYFVLYMASVEFGVYWMHRGLHEVKLGYKLLHSIHHKYNKEHTLSPFAGLAFHPLDGIMQAVPYTWTLFFCPMHFLTHEMLLFATGVWTTNIHDCLHGKVWPIMGAGYHTIHHTTYKHNYGHYFVFVDAMYNTMVTPEQYELDLAQSSKQQPASEQQEQHEEEEQAAASPRGGRAKSGALAKQQQAKADATAHVSPRRGGIKAGKAH